MDRSVRWGIVTGVGVLTATLVGLLYAELNSSINECFELTIQKIWVFLLGAFLPYLVSPCISMLVMFRRQDWEFKALRALKTDKTPGTAGKEVESTGEIAEVVNSFTNQWAGRSRRSYRATSEILLENYHRTVAYQFEAIKTIDDRIVTLFGIATTVLPVSVALFGLQAIWGAKTVSQTAATTNTGDIEIIVHLPSSIELSLIFALGSYVTLVLVFINASRHGSPHAGVSIKDLHHLWQKKVNGEPVEIYELTRAYQSNQENDHLIARRAKDQGIIASCLGMEAVALVVAAGLVLGYL